MKTATEITSRNPVHELAARAVVLVGGRDFGRCPLAARLPTALWPRLERPILGHLLDHLAEAGLSRVAVCCAQEDAAAVETLCQAAPLKTTLVAEELTAGTAGSLRDATVSDPGDLILVFSGSMLSPPPIGDLIEAHRASGADLTVVFNPGRDGESSPGLSAEIYVCRPEILRHIPSRGYSDIKEGVIPSLLRAGGTIRPLVLDREVGNFHNRTGYLLAMKALLCPDGRGTRPREDSAETLVLPGMAASVHSTARLCGPVLLGARARLAEGVVVVGPAVIGPKVTVEAQSVVVRSALWAEARVGSGCEIRDSIVDCRTVLPDGVEVVAGAVSPGLSDRVAVSGWRERGGLGEFGWSSLRRRAASEEHARLRKRWAYVGGGAIILAALLWSYWPTLADLLGTWRRSDEYSCGLLVPFLAAYVLWLRRADLGSVPVRPALLLGLGAFLVAQTVRAVGLFDLYSFVERGSLLLSLAAVVLLVLGWRYLARVATVLLFLCLMLPWPNRLQSAVTLPLQRWSTTAAVFCLELTGLGVQQDGNVIHIGNANVAVAEACNGLRMITAFFVISGLVVLLVKRTGWEKLLILGSSLPIAFLCNTLRLAVTAVAFTWITGEKWEQRFHDWGGYAMMPLALALVVGELWLLTRLTTPPQEIAPVVISRHHPPHVSDLQ